MTFPRLPLLALFASLTVFAVGCAGADGAPAEAEQGTAAAIKSSSSSDHAISQDLLCAAVAAAEQGSEGDGLSGLSERDLKGDALSDFKAFQKGMANDYPSSAYELPVKLGSKTYDFILVVETNDGGGSMGIYRKDGSTVASESSGESDPFTWSSPADKCDK
jgi:hypothetical protein